MRLAALLAAWPRRQSRLSSELRCDAREPSKLAPFLARAASARARAAALSPAAAAAPPQPQARPPPALLPMSDLRLVARDAAQLAAGPEALGGGDAAFVALQRLRRVDGPFAHVAFSREAMALMDALCVSLAQWPESWDTRNLGRCAEELTRFAKLAGLRQQQARFFEAPRVRRAMRALTLAFVPRVSKVLPAPLAGICGALARAQIRYEPVFRAVAGWLVAIDNAHRGWAARDAHAGVFLSPAPVAVAVAGRAGGEPKSGAAGEDLPSWAAWVPTSAAALPPSALAAAVAGASLLGAAATEWTEAHWQPSVDRFWRRCDEDERWRELARSKQRQAFQRSPLQGTPVPVLLNLLWAFAKVRMPVEHYAPFYALLLRRLLLAECGAAWSRQAALGFGVAALRAEGEAAEEATQVQRRMRQPHEQEFEAEFGLDLDLQPVRTLSTSEIELLPVRTSLLASCLGALASVPMDRRLLGPQGAAAWLAAVRRRSGVASVRTGASAGAAVASDSAGPSLIGATAALEEASLPQLKALAASLALRQLAACADAMAPRHAAVAARVVISLGVADTPEGAATLARIVGRARVLLSPQEAPEQVAFVSAFAPGELAPTLSSLGALLRASSCALGAGSHLSHAAPLLLLLNASSHVGALDEFRHIDAAATAAAAAESSDCSETDSEFSAAAPGAIDALPASDEEEAEARLIAYRDTSSGTSSGSERDRESDADSDGFPRRAVRRSFKVAQLASSAATGAATVAPTAPALLPAAAADPASGTGPLPHFLVRQTRLLFALSRESVLGNLGRTSAPWLVHLLCAHVAACEPLPPLSAHICALVASGASSSFVPTANAPQSWMSSLSTALTVDLAWALSCSVWPSPADSSRAGGPVVLLTSERAFKRASAAADSADSLAPVCAGSSAIARAPTRREEGLLLAARARARVASSVGEGATAVRSSSPRGALCVLADALTTPATLGQLAPRQLCALLWALAVADVHHAPLLKACRDHLLSGEAAGVGASVSEIAGAIRVVEASVAPVAHGPLALWPALLVEQLGVAMSLIAARPPPFAAATAEGAITGPWSRDAVSLLRAADAELASRAASAASGLDEDDEEEEGESGALSLAFPPFSAASGARTVVRVTAALLDSRAAANAVGDQLMLGGESGGWGLAELPRGSGKAAAASLRVHQQLDALLQQQQQQQQPQLHQPPPQQKPLGGVVRHLYRTCGGAVLIPVALPQQRLAVFWDAAPVRSAGAAAEAAAPALLPAAVVAAYERWQRNVVALAGWRVCELGAASFLGASGVEGKLRLLRSAGLDRA